MSKLTKRQNEILNLIQSHMDATGSPPTRAEIAKTMGFRSPNAAEDHLRALARKGVIELVPGTSRGIRLTRASGGIPVLTDPHLLSVMEANPAASVGTQSCRVERSLFKPQVDFFIRVKTQNLRDVGIMEGDYLAVHRSQTADKGQLAIFNSGGDFTIKRYSPELEQSNQTLEGIGVGIIRPLLTPSLK